jgi:hypothetical protein
VTALSGLFAGSPVELGDELERAERLLRRAEQTIRLLDRLVPTNLVPERERLRRALEAGRVAEPRFEYAAAPEVEALRPFLSSLASTLYGSGPVGQLYAERASELELEAALVTSAGRREFLTLARTRHAPEGLASRAETDELVAAWLGEAEPQRESDAETRRADDEGDRRSLLSLLRAQVGALRVPVRIELRPGLPSVAAAGDGFVAIRPEARLSQLEAERIACHELLAHVLPRLCARREALGIFRVGCRGSGDEEEGRALLLEERAGFLGAARRRELSLRHRSALLMHEGASWSDVVRWLETEHVARERAMELGLRVARGGGLGREVVYIPAYIRLSRELSREPALERFFERGRVTVASARVLRGVERLSAESD